MRRSYAIRLIVTITAAPGEAPSSRSYIKRGCAEVMSETGCEQFELFQSAVNPDKAGPTGTLGGPASFGSAFKTEQ